MKESEKIILKEVSKLRAKAKRKQYEADQANKQADILIKENGLTENNYEIRV